MRQQQFSLHPRRRRANQGGAVLIYRGPRPAGPPDSCGTPVLARKHSTHLPPGVRSTISLWSSGRNSEMFLKVLPGPVESVAEGIERLRSSQEHPQDDQL